MAKVYTVNSISPVVQMPPAVVVSHETDDEIMNRLRRRFGILEDMTQAVKAGGVRGLIVTGAAGVGKSWGVEKVLGRYDSFANIAQDNKLKQYEIIKGEISALHLFVKLHEYKDEKSVVVFDDCDIWGDENCVQLMKAALDTSKARSINWNKDSKLLKSEGIDNSFEFKGGVIFITNVNFDNVRSKKMRDHLTALESRCHFLDLTIGSEREVMLRIRQVIGDGMLDKYNFDDEVVREIIDFVDVNKKKLREFSLRTVIKAADLKKSFGHNWQNYATETLIDRFK